MVVIKDFTNLYALAHEYHEWLHADAFIPPDRIFLTALSQDPLLVAKLRRFNNYRRVLYTHLPGPGPQIHEEDGWFRSYQEESPVPIKAANQETPASAQQTTGTTTPTLSQKDPAREVSKNSPKRKRNESSQRDGFLGDSFDSASPFSDEPLRKRGTSHRNQEYEPVAEVAALPAVSTCPALAPGQHTQGARRLTRRERAETSQETLLATRTGSTHAKQSEAQQQPRMLDYPLARSFLQEIAVPFGDRNPKGSTTRVVGIIANASLEQNEVLLCLVRAYTVARDTSTLRPTHYDQATGRANRMPLFCTLFERFVQARVQNGKWNYSWQQKEDDLAADNRLRLWWIEHQALFAKETQAPYENQAVPASGVQEKQTELKESPEPVIGWARREAAHAWGEQLLEALTAGGYEAEVRMHLESRWYQLVLIGEGCEYVLVTSEQVQFVIEQAKRGGL